MLGQGEALRLAGSLSLCLLILAHSHSLPLFFHSPSLTLTHSLTHSHHQDTKLSSIHASTLAFTSYTHPLTRRNGRRLKTTRSFAPVRAARFFFLIYTHARTAWTVYHYTLCTILLLLLTVPTVLSPYSHTHCTHYTHTLTIGTTIGTKRGVMRYLNGE
jgi:hypothetical protein